LLCCLISCEHICISYGILSELGRSDPLEMLFEYVNRSYYIQGVMSILLMRGTYLFDLYGDHIDFYIVNM